MYRRELNNANAVKMKQVPGTCFTPNISYMFLKAKVALGTFWEQQTHW